MRYKLLVCSHNYKQTEEKFTICNQTQQEQLEKNLK